MQCQFLPGNVLRTLFFFACRRCPVGSWKPTEQTCDFLSVGGTKSLINNVINNHDSSWMIEWSIIMNITHYPNIPLLTIMNHQFFLTSLTSVPAMQEEGQIALRAQVRSDDDWTQLGGSMVILWLLSIQNRSWCCWRTQKQILNVSSNSVPNGINNDQLMDGNSVKFGIIPYTTYSIFCLLCMEWPQMTNWCCFEGSRISSTLLSCWNGKLRWCPSCLDKTNREPYRSSQTVFKP